MELLEIIEKMCQPCSVNFVDNDKRYFFGGFAAEPSKFRFLPGDLNLIKGVIKYIKTTVFERGLQYFQAKNRSQKTCDTYEFPFGTFFARRESTNEISQSTSECSFNEEEIRLDLFERKLKPHLERTSEKVDLIKPIKDDIVKIINAGNKMQAIVVCVFCDKRNNQTIKIQCSVSPKMVYWNISNFKKHLEVHRKFIERSSELDSNSNAAISSSLSLSDDNTNTNNETDESISTTANESLFGDIFQKMSKQNQKMKVNEMTKIMKFKIGTSIDAVNVIEIKPNGSCLFASIAHQIYHFKVNSPEHEQATKYLRSEVVKYIQLNYDNFNRALKGRVYERRNSRTQKLSPNELELNCRQFLREILPRSDCWGGYESIKALSEMKKINIVTISENGACYFAVDYKEEYEQLIFLAYRLSAPTTNGVYNEQDTKRNHYDSVDEIDHATLFKITKHLVQTIKKKGKSGIISIDD